MLLQPMQYIPAVDGALTQLVTSLHDPIKHDILGKECQYPFTLIRVEPFCLLTDLPTLFLMHVSVHVGLRGSFGQQHCNPRTLRSHQIGKMVSLEGIVTRCEFASRTLPQPLAICGSRLTLLLNISPCQTKCRLARPTQNAQVHSLLPIHSAFPFPNVPR